MVFTLYYGPLEIDNYFSGEDGLKQQDPSIIRRFCGLHWEEKNTYALVPNPSSLVCFSYE